MPGIELHQPHRGLTLGADPANIAQHIAASPGGLKARLHLHIILRQLGKELVAATTRQRGRHQTLDLHIGHLQPQTHLAPEDDQLARHIHAGQVVTRIGLGVATVLGIPHDR